MACACPVCQGKQTMPRNFYEAGACECESCAATNAERVPCRSCGGTGVVWPPQPVGPLRVTGDLIVEGNVVSAGYREWLRADQVRGVDVVSGDVPGGIPDVEPYVAAGEGRS